MRIKIENTTTFTSRPKDGKKYSDFFLRRLQNMKNALSDKENSENIIIDNNEGTTQNTNQKVSTRKSYSYLDEGRINPRFICATRATLARNGIPWTPRTLTLARKRKLLAMRKRARETVKLYGEFGSDTWVIACLYFMNEPRVLTRDDIYEWREQYPKLFTHPKEKPMQPRKPKPSMDSDAVSITSRPKRVVKLNPEYYNDENIVDHSYVPH